MFCETLGRYIGFQLIFGVILVIKSYTKTRNNLKNHLLEFLIITPRGAHNVLRDADKKRRDVRLPRVELRRIF